MSKADIGPFLAALEDRFPDAAGELLWADHFTLLVAVVLSAQTTDKAVNKVTGRLFAAAPDPKAMAALGEEKIGEMIKTVGLWQSKARNLVLLSRRLSEVFAGVVPARFEDLISLPGVGRKTANVVLNMAFHQPTIAVDTHIFRLANRTGLAPGKTPLDVERGLVQRIPDSFKLKAHHLLILQGRYVCKARKPLCGACKAARFCRFEAKTTATE